MKASAEGMAGLCNEDRGIVMQYEDATYEIIGACLEVSNKPGDGFLESVYQNALAIALEEKGFAVETEVPLAVSFRGRTVAEFINATGLEVGLLVNFGQPKIQ